MAANKQYVDSKISGAVDHIQNTNSSAVVNANLDATVSIKASNGSSALVISSTNNNNYKIANSGPVEVQTGSILTLNAG